jgi:prolipoprotein diacylglyceryltransferase
MRAALIEIAFDPVLHLGDLDIRWQTVGLTITLLIALGLAARIGSYLPPRVPIVAGPQYPDAPAVGSSASATELPTAQRLRLDDLAYIVLGIVPGAVVGGRVVHAIIFWDAYAADPSRLLDAGVGTLSLLGAVLGGALTGGYVAGLAAMSVRRWADALALPLLLALGLGKLAQLLGGSGQGAAFDGGWAVAFIGAGPWHGLSPELAAHPSQIYEGLWMLTGIPLLLRLVGSGPDLWRALPARLAPRRATPPTAGLLFLTALAWFLAGRVVVGFTWRDAVVAGPLNGEQAVALAILCGVLVGLAVRGARSGTREVARTG